MWLSEHVATAPLLASILWLANRPGDEIVVATATSILVDIDHFPDYFLEYGFKIPNLHHFFEACYNEAFSKFYLLLHSLEICFLLIIGYFIGYPLIGALGIGILYHLVWDQVYNNTFWGTYSLVYRFYVGFEAKRIFQVDPLRRT